MLHRSRSQRPHKIIGRSMWLVLISTVLSFGGVVLVSGGAKAAPGQWSVTPSPNNAGGGNTLISVSCTSSSFCMALGQSYTDGSGAEDTLVEQWNGTVWSIIPGPSLPSGSPSYSLSSISCVGPTSCIAVGSISAPGNHFGLQTQAEAATWNGASWTMSQYNALNGSAYTAVADGAPVGVTWDADDFPIAPANAVFSPAPDGLGRLNAASCGGGMCMAVGYWNDFSSNEGPSVAVWGNAPATITAPPVSGALYAVVCSGPTFCAVPGYEWNGSTWSAGGPGASAAMSCASATDCVAVSGSSIQSWDGTSWSSDTNPSPDGGLNAISCISSSDCVAVGGTPAGTLVETGTPIPTVPQTITFTSNAPANATVGGSNYVPTAAGGASGQPVQITVDAASSSVCSISGGAVSFTGSGNCTLDANQAGAGVYLPAAQVQQSFSVGPVVITSTNLANGSVRVPYSASLAATGGLAPYHWSLTSGSLPSGLHLTARGAIRGRPSASGSSSFTVMVVDHHTRTHSQESATASFTITVTQPTPVVLAVHPDDGPVTGGTSVVITGTSLWAPSLVMFGLYSATIVTVNATGTRLIAQAPAQSAGTVDIVVTTPGGPSQTTPSDLFTYP
jgi:hypothetical protein